MITKWTVNKNCAVSENLKNEIEYCEFAKRNDVLFAIIIYQHEIVCKIERIYESLQDCDFPTRDNASNLSCSQNSTFSLRSFKI